MAKIDTQKIIAPIMKFVNMRGIIALKDGMLAILPLTVVGSIFLIVGQLPFEGLNQAIAGIFGKNWTEPFMQVYSGTFAIMGLIFQKLQVPADIPECIGRAVVHPAMADSSLDFLLQLRHKPEVFPIAGQRNAIGHSLVQI